MSKVLLISSNLIASFAQEVAQVQLICRHL